MNTKILKFSIFAIIAILAFSCKNYEPLKINYEPLDMSKIISIEELINSSSVLGDMFPVRTNSGYPASPSGIYSVDTINSGGENIIIAGRIISDDSQGNIYKSITIQDIKDPKYALKISIDASGIGAWYPLGSVISIRCNGLAIGKYADMFQLGTVYFNNNADAAKRGYEPGRIPLPLFQVRVKTHSLPEIDKIVVDTLTIAQINKAATDRTLHSRLICIKNAYFTGQGVDYGQPATLSEKDKIFAPTTNGIGFPQSRVIRDGASATSWTVVATSEYARFCNVKIPTDEYVGTITAIIGWYKDRYNRDGSVQLTIRSLDDLQLYSPEDGTKWQP